MIKRLNEQFAANEKLIGTRTRVLRLDFGPPIGFPVQFRVLGPDAEQLRRIAYQVRDKMREFEETREVHLSWDEQSKLVRLEVDQDRARAMGLTPQEISQTLQTLLDGVAISQYREGIELVDVVVRAVDQERLKLDEIPNINILTTKGRSVPISQVARIRMDSEEASIWRRNRDLTLTVRCDIAEGLQPPDVTAKIKPSIDAIAATLPPEYRIEVGGATEESAKPTHPSSRSFQSWRC